MDNANDDVVNSHFVIFQAPLIRVWRLVLAAVHCADDDWQFLIRLLLLRRHLVAVWWRRHRRGTGRTRHEARGRGDEGLQRVRLS